MKMKPLAEEVLKNQQIPDQKISFVPERFEHTFTQWLENIEDWCISRVQYRAWNAILATQKKMMSYPVTSVFVG